MNGTPYTPCHQSRVWAIIFNSECYKAQARMLELHHNMSVSMYADRTLESRPPEKYDDISPCQRSYALDGSPLWHLFIHKEN